MFERIKTNLIVRWVSQFFGSAPDSIRSHLNLNELARVVVASLLSGGGAYEVVLALAESIPRWADPADVGLVTAGLVLVLEIWRRLGHGDATPPVPPPPSGPSLSTSVV